MDTLPRTEAQPALNQAAQGANVVREADAVGADETVAELRYR